MMRHAVALCLILLPAVAAAQGNSDGALGPILPRDTERPAAMSRAQIAQMVADRGYYEMDGLRPQRDGSWTCIAMAGPGERVALTIRRDGTILQQDLPRQDAQQ
jgi:hypothetical protein